MGADCDLQFHISPYVFIIGSRPLEFAAAVVLELVHAGRFSKPAWISQIHNKQLNYALSVSVELKV